MPFENVVDIPGVDAFSIIGHRYFYQQGGVFHPNLDFDGEAFLLFFQPGLKAFRSLKYDILYDIVIFHKLDNTRIQPCKLQEICGQHLYALQFLLTLLKKRGDDFPVRDLLLHDVGIHDQCG